MVVTSRTTTVGAGRAVGAVKGNLTVRGRRSAVRVGDTTTVNKVNGRLSSASGNWGLYHGISGKRVADQPYIKNHYREIDRGGRVSSDVRRFTRVAANVALVLTLVTDNNMLQYYTYTRYVNRLP